MSYDTRIWNVILNDVKQYEYNVDENIARSIKDKLLKDGHNTVSIVRYEGKVKYVYTFKNKENAKKNFKED